MIVYDTGKFHIQFIFACHGSAIPKGLVFSVPSGVFAVVCRFLATTFPDAFIFLPHRNTITWSSLVLVLAMLISFRMNVAYGRFWEGVTLVQQMRAEWFESCSNLTAFSNYSVIRSPGDESLQVAVDKFQYTLVRLVSLMHAAALRQVTGGSDFACIDLNGLDDESLGYLGQECRLNHVNRVEVLLHWIQVLVSDNMATGVITMPAPILTRAFQTLSRGMVNLHNARKLTDVPYPFPLAQFSIVLLVVQTVMTPVVIAGLTETYFSAGMFTFLPIFGMWCVTYIAAEMEQPFGHDTNDLPLEDLCTEMNRSLLMLLDLKSMRAPDLKVDAANTVQMLRDRLTDTDSTTAFLGSVISSWSKRKAGRRATRTTGAGPKGKETRKVSIQAIPSQDSFLSEGSCSPMEAIQVFRHSCNLDNGEEEVDRLDENELRLLLGNRDMPPEEVERFFEGEGQSSLQPVADIEDVQIECRGSNIQEEEGGGEQRERIRRSIQEEEGEEENGERRSDEERKREEEECGESADLEGRREGEIKIDEPWRDRGEPCSNSLAGDSIGILDCIFREVSTKLTTGSGSMRNVVGCISVDVPVLVASGVDGISVGLGLLDEGSDPPVPAPPVLLIGLRCGGREGIIDENVSDKSPSEDH